MTQPIKSHQTCHSIYPIGSDAHQQELILSPRTELPSWGCRGLLASYGLSSDLKMRRTLMSQSLDNCPRNTFTTQWEIVASSVQSQQPCQPHCRLFPSGSQRPSIFMTHSLGFSCAGSLCTFAHPCLPSFVRPVPTWKTLTFKDQSILTSGLTLTPLAQSEATPPSSDA